MSFVRLLVCSVVVAVTCAACTQSSGSDSRSSSAPSPSLTAARSPAASPTSPASHPHTRTPAPIPPLSANARAAGLVDIRMIVADAIVDLRYATTDNFVRARLYPIDARCLVHQSMAAGLITAARQLRRAGFVLVFWDCYRPHAVQVHMFQVVPNPNWVARPGPYATSHESARSVDATLAYRSAAQRCVAERRVQRHCLLDMGTGFDDFTLRAHAFATADVSSRAQANRARLRAAMNAGGIVVYSGEWWHFDGPGALVQRPILDVPVD